MRPIYKEKNMNHIISLTPVIDAETATLQAKNKKLTRNRVYAGLFCAGLVADIALTVALVLKND